MTGDCIRCDRHLTLKARQLCWYCYVRGKRTGDLDDYGYVKAHRYAEYIRLRALSVPVAEAARRVCVSERTGWRYEAERRATQTTAA